MAGVGTNIFASTGLSASADSGSASTASLDTQTYGPSAQGSSGVFSPRRPQALGFWLACGGVVVLVCIRQSLPR